MDACRVILIVEDDQNLRDSLQMVLEAEGYHVLTASNGKEALELLPKLEPPGLILLDLTMPVMSGLEFLEAFCVHSSSSIPVIVVSAVAEVTEIPKFVTAVVHKPYDIDFLLGLVRKHCGHPRTS